MTTGPGLSETRTRFKEDCDSYSTSTILPSLGFSRKPGLASKRIATSKVGAFSISTTRGRKPGLASKRIATNVASNPACRSASARSETRTRFKEDCDRHATKGRVALVNVSETRTRFKEDCDNSGKTLHRPSRRCVGNQDSLQRGLRLRRKSAGSRIHHWVGNQDSLQRGLRPSSSHAVGNGTTQ